MKFWKLAAIAGTCIMLGGLYGCEDAEAQAARIRIGQVDVERVYNEYHGMREFQAGMLDIQQEFQQAQEAGDQQKLIELQQEFQLKQEAFHAEFESSLADATEAVSGEAGVDLVAAQVIYHGDDVDVVDISGELIAEMNEGAPEPEAQPGMFQTP